MMSNLKQISPNFFYGTAWKEDLTESCLTNALKVGFRAIDTANQRKHYFEEGVGSALKRANQELGLNRQDLFIQSKFTYARGQDHRKPYDEKSPLKIQLILEQMKKTIQQVIFRFAQQVGMIPVVGTRSVDHMKLDLEAEYFNLSDEQLKCIEEIATLS